MAVSTTDDDETQITLVRGDSDDLLVTVTDAEDPPVAIDLSAATDGTPARPAIVRFAVKDDPDDQDNTEALFYKHSAYSDQIAVLQQSGATLGQCRVYVDKPDTESADLRKDYRWDVEITRQDILRADASIGTVAFTSGSKTVTGSGTAFTKAKVGDVLQPIGGANTKPAIVQEVVSATSLLVDHDNWTTESGVTFEIRRGKSKTGNRGPFVLQSGVVAV